MLQSVPVYNGFMDTEMIEQRYALISPFLDERQRRLYLAAETKVIGYGSVSTVSRMTGVSRRAISAGYEDFGQAKEKLSNGRIRRESGGCKRTPEKDVTLKTDLEALIEPLTRGDSESPLRWTCKSVRNLSDELNRMDHKTSHRMVAELLHEMEYSLQGNRKTLEGESHPDRNAQFEFNNSLSQSNQGV